jgi:hypothetical protein
LLNHPDQLAKLRDLVGQPVADPMAAKSRQTGSDRVGSVSDWIGAGLSTLAQWCCTGLSTLAQMGSQSWQRVQSTSTWMKLSFSGMVLIGYWWWMQMRPYARPFLQALVLSGLLAVAAYLAEPWLAALISGLSSLVTVFRTFMGWQLGEERPLRQADQDAAVSA